MIPGETIRTGAPETCDECNETPKLQVCHSGAGFYIGTMCQCGPYSRESEYYSTRQGAQEAFDREQVLWRDRFQPVG
jgi:hypothetical protein